MKQALPAKLFAWIGTGCAVCAFLLLPHLSTGAPAAQDSAAAHVWLGSDGNPLPFKTDEEILEFLRTAQVVSLQDIPVGVTRPRRAVLEKDGVRSHAIFRDVDSEMDSFQVAGRRERNVRDSALFECAAYEVARLLGLDNIPPVVDRAVEGKKGSVQFWIEKAMTEEDRLKRGQRAPNIVRWNMQMQTVRIFDALISNWDRTQQNVLIGEDWKLWMVDHTRAFLRRDELLDTARLVNCDRKLWARLQALDEADVREHLKPYLRPAEIDALLKRRSKLIAFFKAQIAKRGESDVLYDAI